MAEQEIRFTEEGGRRIAWARTGEGPPLVFAGWWMSHVELNWRDPRFRAYIEALGRHRTIIRYDPPGTGLSAEDTVAVQTLESDAAALAAVIDAAGVARVDLIAASSGAPVGLAFAAARPERLGKLVIYGGYAAGTSIADERSRAAIVELVGEHWGLGSRTLADIFMPSADGESRDAFVSFQREATTPARAARSLEAVYRFDATAHLGAVSTPATVLHRRGDRAIAFALGRELAAALPDATLVALDGADHYPWFGDSDAVLRATLTALGVDDPPAVSPLPDPAPPAEADLTRRETEVLALVANGLSTREIAERLVLSPHTVHRHVANVRTKLGLPTRAAAVAAATKRGLL